MPDGSTIYDDEREAKKVFSMYGDDATELFTTSSDDVNLSINTMPEISEGVSYSIPLHFKAATSSVYNIHASNIESFDQDTKIILEDELMNINKPF